MTERSSTTPSRGERIAAFRDRATEKVGRMVAGATFNTKQFKINLEDYDEDNLDKLPQDTAYATYEPNLKETHYQDSYVGKRLARKQEIRDDYDNATDRPIDQLLTDDKEILGESLHLRRALRGATRSVMDNLHEARVSTRDVISTPRTKYLENFRDRNALKIQRLEDKISANPDAPEFKRDKEWLAMYKARHDHWNGKLKRQSSKQVSRSETLGIKTEERKEKYQLSIDKYIDKKIESVRKKGFRKLQKEQGIGRFDHRAQVQFFKQLSIEERRKITAEAIEAVRYKNIRKGKLEQGYAVAADPDEVTRIMSDYERTFK